MQNLNEDTNNKQQLCALVCADVIHIRSKSASSNSPESNSGFPPETPPVSPDIKPPAPIKEPPQKPVPSEVPPPEPKKTPSPPIALISLIGWLVFWEKQKISSSR